MLRSINEYKFPLFLLLMILVFYHKIFLHPTEMITASDVIGTYALEKWFFSYSIKTLHSFPLWNPYIFSGTPFPGNLTTALFYPLNLLYVLIPSDVAFGFMYVIDVYFISLFTYLFARKIKLDQISSFTAAIIFSFSASVAARIIPGHVFMLDNLVWFPLLLLFYEHIILKQKFIYGVAAGIPIACMFLSGFVQIAFYSLCAASLYFSLRLIFEKITIRKKILLFSFFCLSFILGLGLAAVQLIPTIEFLQQSLRTNGLPYNVATSFSLHPYQLILSIFPYIFGDAFHFWSKGNFHENALYVGIPSLMLALLALIHLKNKYIYIFSFLAIVSLSYAFGKYSPVFYLFYKYIPVFGSFRVPVRFLFVYSFSLAILAGFGMQILQKENVIFWKNNFVKISNYFLFIISSTFLLLAVYASFFKNSLSLFETYVLQNKYAIDINHGILYNFFLRDLWVFSISIFIVSVFLFLRKNNLLHIQKIRICIICLIIFDLWFFGKDFITTKKPESIFPTPPIIQKIKKDTGTYRVFDLSQRLYHVVTRNALESTIGVNSMQLKDYHDFFWLVGDHENWEYESFFQFKHKISNPQILNLLNVKYIISDEKLNNHEFQKIYTSSDQLSAIALPALQKHPGFFLYKNTTVLPRAYIVPRAQIIDNRKETLKKILDKKFHPKEVVILNECHSCESDIPVDKGSGMRGFQNVAITSYTPDKIVLHTILHTSGFLVFSELWYPGWKAYDNGKEVPIYKADLLFRAVALTKGNHIIIFSYEPASIKIGEIISGITIFLIIGYILLYNRHLWQRKN